MSLGLMERRQLLRPENGRRGLDRYIRSAPRYATLRDLNLLGNLNHIVQEERYGLGGSDPLAVSSSDASGTTPGGFRVFGNGIAENDSGFVQISGTPAARLTTTNENTHTAAVGTPVIWQPDTHGPVRISALISLPALTNRAVFFGFMGVAADSLAEAVTGVRGGPANARTYTLTLAADDLVGLFMDSGIADYVSRVFTPHNKSNAAASTQNALDVDSGYDVVANRLMVWSLELSDDGTVYWGIEDSTGVIAEGSIASALDADEEHAAVLYVAAGSAAIATLDVYALALDAYAAN